MKKTAALLGALALFFNSAASAGHHEGGHDSLVKKTLLASLDGSFEKIDALANEFSEEQYGWRPAEGIRSVKDSILHVAAANYFLGGRLGGEIPEGVKPRSFEKEIESKQEAIETLNASIKFIKAAIKKNSEEDLAEVVNLFGNEAPKMRAAFVVAEHANEHLGQLIAYARSTGVVPPWSK